MIIISRFFGIILICLVVVFFFRNVVLDKKIPVPSDTIVGLYHPFRDLYAKKYPNGIPFKNFLLTDPVRQQLPWRDLAVSIAKRGEIPLWNPYSFSGTPLLANFQTAIFYPLNILFFLFSFHDAWTLLIVFQPLLGGTFMYLYLRYFRLHTGSCFLGAVVFAFSGSSIAWMEWNTVFHTVLWLPLILLAMEHLLGKKSIKWIVILMFAETSAVFAGHLQTLFYAILVSNAYLMVRIWQIHSGDKNVPKNYIKTYALFLLVGLLVLLTTAVQSVPTAQFIFYSAREIDQSMANKEGWFIPFQHLVQFIAPDFFGNPSTLNYWGVWNYAEFIGYVSILPLIMVLYALFYRRDRKVLFFGAVLGGSLLFATDNPIARTPYVLDVPFISTSQPTRLIIIADLALTVLCALGFDYFFKKKKHVFTPMAIILVFFVLLWLSVLSQQFGLHDESLVVARRNLILPTIVFIGSAIVIVMLTYIKNILLSRCFAILLMLILLYDFFRFGDKFLPFVQKEYLFPQTKTIEFLQKNAGVYRIMSIDNRILAPNFSIFYKLQTVEGYDPLYLRRYGELIAASERGKPDISSPFGFNRIITPHNYNSKIIDLLGVKYILSLSDINSPKLRKVFQEGETRVYENINVMPRVFFVEQIYFPKDTQDSMNAIFNKEFDFTKIAVADIKQGDNTKNKKIQVAPGSFSAKMPAGSAEIIFLSENKVIIKTNNTESNGLLVLTDSYYPTWRAKINNDYETPISRIDYNFRGVSVPKGTHTVEFYNTLF